MSDPAGLKSAGVHGLRGEPPLQGQRLRFGRGPPLQGQKLRFGWGPPLQGDFVRRVVPRPAPTRGRGTSMYRSDEIPLQRRPSRSWCSPLRRALPSCCRNRHRRSHGPSVGERRGSAGIGRKQAMDGLRSPVGAMDGGIRRCARSPHCRGSPPKPADSVASKPGRIRHPTFGEEPFRVPVRPAGGGRRSSWRGAGRHRANRPVRPAGRCPRARNRRAGPVAGGRGRADPGPGHR